MNLWKTLTTIPPLYNNLLPLDEYDTLICEKLRIHSVRVLIQTYIAASLGIELPLKFEMSLLSYTISYATTLSALNYIFVSKMSLLYESYNLLSNFKAVLGF